MTGFYPTLARPTEYGQSREERLRALDCQRSHRDHWVVFARNGNHSAFNGYNWTPSAYSAVRCRHCGRRWRTKANYVRHLPDARDVIRAELDQADRQPKDDP